MHSFQLVSTEEYHISCLKAIIHMKVEINSSMFYDLSDDTTHYHSNSIETREETNEKKQTKNTKHWSFERVLLSIFIDARSKGQNKINNRFFLYQKYKVFYLLLEIHMIIWPYDNIWNGTQCHLQLFLRVKRTWWTLYAPFDGTG